MIEETEEPVQTRWLHPSGSTSLQRPLAVVDDLEAVCRRNSQRTLDIERAQFSRNGAKTGRRQVCWLSRPNVGDRR